MSTSRDMIWQHFREGGTVSTAVQVFDLTYFSAKHHHTRWQKSEGSPNKHHPEGKRIQIEAVLEGKSDLSIYELYGGHGYCTGVYESYGSVTSRTHADGNDWHVLHAELASKRTYDVVDVDGYGYPSRILSSGVVELLKTAGVMFITLPIYGSNQLNPITSAHLQIFYGTRTPGLEDFVRAIKAHALAYHRVAELIHSARLGGVWRLAFEVRRVPATLLYGVRNNANSIKTEPLLLDVPSIFLDLEEARSRTRKVPVEDGLTVFDLFGESALPARSGIVEETP